MDVRSFDYSHLVTFGYVKASEKEYKISQVIPYEIIELICHHHYKINRAPVDEYFKDGNIAGYSVYEKNGVVYDAMLNQTNINKNNNKFYKLQVLKHDDRNEFHTWFRWARVGYKGQTKDIPSDKADCIERFEAKFYQKTLNHWEDRNDFEARAKKYTYLSQILDKSVHDAEFPPSVPREYVCFNCKAVGKHWIMKCVFKSREYPAIDKLNNCPTGDPACPNLSVSRFMYKTERDKCKTLNIIDTPIEQQQPIQQQQPTMNHCSSIYVGNVPLQLTDEHMRQLFEPFGTVISVAVVQKTQDYKYGFVNFQQPQDAARALIVMNGKSIGGKTLQVKPANTDISNALL